MVSFRKTKLQAIKVGAKTSQFEARKTTKLRLFVCVVSGVASRLQVFMCTKSVNVNMH